MSLGSIVHHYTSSLHGRHGLENALTGGIANIGRNFGDNTNIGRSIDNYNLWSNHAARQRETDARLRALEESHSIAGRVNDLHAVFGDYTGNDQNLIQASQANLAGRNAGYENYRQAYLSYFNPQLDEQFNTAGHNNLFAGVNTGTSGGSADQLRQQNTLGKYVTARANVGGRADQGVNDLKSADSSRELSLQDQIQHGGDAASLIGQGITNAQGSIAAARDSIPTDTLGDVFNNAGNLYEQSQVAQGYGRRGFSLMPTGSSSSGSITGS